MYIDSHCHLFYEDYRNDIAEVIGRAEDQGVKAFVIPATNHHTARQAIELCEKYPNVFFCAGFHPLDLEHFNEDNFAIIEELLGHPKSVAVGEIGIDYFYDRSPAELQKQVFSRHIELAIQKNKPIVVHTRDSVQDAIDIVERYVLKNPDWMITNGSDPGKRGVFHCFTGSVEQAEKLFTLHFFVSFPGPITFKKSTMPEVLQKIGLKNVLIETDSPFLTPIPHRGKRNEPAYIPLIAQKIEEILNISTEEVARTTTSNAIQLFHLPIVGE